MSQLPAGAVPAFLGAHPAHRGADRALSHPAPCSGAVLGVAARQAAAAAASKSGGVAIEGAQTKRHDGERQGADGARASASSSRGAMRWRSSSPSCCGSSASICGRITGGTCRTPSRSCSTTPKWRCSRSASPTSSPPAISTSRSARCWRWPAAPPPIA